MWIANTPEIMRIEKTTLGAMEGFCLGGSSCIPEVSSWQGWPPLKISNRLSVLPASLILTPQR
jgi:hypothetical protein